MSGEDPLALLRALYDAYATRAFERAADGLTEDAELVNVATGEVLAGRDGYLQLARAWTAAFPDLRVEILRLSASEEVGVVEYVLRGTHTGALLTVNGFIPPTWSRVELRLCDVLQLDAGRIARVSTYLDSATLLRQMGLLPHSPLHPAERRAALDLYVSEVDRASEQRNKAIVHRFLEEVINQKNPAAAAGVCTPNLVWHGGAMGEARDLPTFQSLLASVFASFPDLNLEVHDVIAEADRVAVRLTLRATQLGQFQGIAPTGRRIVGSGMNTYRILDGRIIEEWWQHDMLGALRQPDALHGPLQGS